jgi:hypothetical protein
VLLDPAPAVGVRAGRFPPLTLPASTLREDH